MRNFNFPLCILIAEALDAYQTNINAEALSAIGLQRDADDAAQLCFQSHSCGLNPPTEAFLFQYTTQSS